jgi:hypothetical protein
VEPLPRLEGKVHFKGPLIYELLENAPVIAEDDVLVTFKIVVAVVVIIPPFKETTPALEIVNGEVNVVVPLFIVKFFKVNAEAGVPITLIKLAVAPITIFEVAPPVSVPAVFVIPPFRVNVFAPIVRVPAVLTKIPPTITFPTIAFVPTVLISRLLYVVEATLAVALL